MEKIKTIVIDDEISARETLISMLERFFPEIEVVAEASGIEDGINVLNSVEKDLVFLDIEMPYGNSFNILENIDNLDFGIIFITAHDQYAINAFKFSAIDYLIKPVKIKELKNAIERYKKIHFSKSTQNSQIRVLLNNINNQKKKIVLPTIHGFNIVDISTILRCESERNYTRFVFKNEEKILVSKTLKEFEEILKEHGFFRIHQSYLVNLEYIKKYTRGQGGEIEMTDGKIIPVSKSKKDEFLKLFL
ncbi:MAG: LytTR family DNA-binding domain-containing protein [Marinilabiliales bacterium]